MSGRSLHRSILLCIALVLSSVRAYNGSSLRGSPNTVNVASSKRRSLLNNMMVSSLTAVTLFPRRALATDSSTDTLVDVYFGVGCYWHIQHEFVEAERLILQRDDGQLTSRTGYAGGKKLGTEGRVCYHNYQGLADYGKLGHAEVVGMKIPENKVEDFAKVYFDLFDPTTGERVDPQDKGSEYRSLIGLPGGVQHPMYAAVVAAGAAKGFTVEVGKGSEPDTLGKNKLVNIYDTHKFPFHQAEVYMQFRDDFQSPAYGKDYNSLVELALEDGRIIGQGCPDTY